MRYHQRADGEIRKCFKASGRCGAADNENHWGSKIEAIEASMRRGASIEDKKFLGISRSLEKKMPKPKICWNCKESKIIQSSHTIPDSILRRLNPSEGLLLTTLFFTPSLLNLDASLIDGQAKVGRKQALTFELLCNRCDSTVFSKYENSYNNSNWRPTERDFFLIALKNFLYRKYTWDKEMLLLTQKPIIKNPENVVQDAINSLKYFKFEPPSKKLLDKINYDLKRSYERLHVFNKRSFVKIEYKQLYYINLSYITPFAAQGAFSVNELPSGVRIRENIVHIAVLPYDSGTHVLVFAESDSRVFDKWKPNNTNDILDWISILTDNADEGFIFSPYLHKDFPIKWPKYLKLFNKKYGLNQTLTSKKINWEKLFLRRDSFFMIR